MIETAGLTHIHLAVRDLARSVSFYQVVFGMQGLEREEEGMVFLRTPGASDTLTLRQAAPGETTGSGGGLDHFGFRLRQPADLEDAIHQVVQAGGRLEERGEHTPGVPYAYVSDPDGYVIEL